MARFFARLRGPLFGAAVASLIFVTASALAGSGVGGVFNLGQSNTVDAQTLLTGTSNAAAQLRVENASTAAASFGVLGKITSPSGAADAAGVRGTNSSSGSNGFGVVGVHTGAGAGVFGSTQNGTGLLGKHSGTGGTLPGVEGDTSSTAAGAVAVLGKTTTGGASNPTSAGVEGVNDGHGYGLFGVAGPADDSIAIFGQGTKAPAIKGVTGSANSTAANTDAAVVGIQQSEFGSGVLGETPNGGFGVLGLDTGFLGGRGVQGVSTNGIGVYGAGKQAGGFFTSSGDDAVDAETTSPGHAGVFGHYGRGGVGIGVLGGVFVTNGGAPTEGLSTMGIKGIVSVHNSVGTAGFADNGTAAIGVRGVSKEGTGVQGETTSGLAGKFVGDVRVTGKVTKDYAPNTTSQAIPLAYGVVNSSGTKASGTPNFSSSFDAANNRYLITITGDSYNSATHMTVVTPLQGAGPALARTTAVSGKLAVLLTGGGTATPVQQAFSFITYRP
jgi:hypothetical protein